MIEITSIQFKRGAKAALVAKLIGSARPLPGEPVYEIDTGSVKIGDGVHDYGDLPYIPRLTIYDSSQLEESVGKALKLDNIELSADELVAGTVYRVQWKVAPTSTNQVYGYAMHPTTGEWLIIYSDHGVKSVRSIGGNVASITEADIDELFTEEL